jgi:hypothetical protein
VSEVVASEIEEADVDLVTVVMTVAEVWTTVVVG